MRGKKEGKEKADKVRRQAWENENKRWWMIREKRDEGRKKGKDVREGKEKVEKDT